MHMHMILAHYPLKDTHIFGIANLKNKRPTPMLDLPAKHMITVFRYPDHMRREPGYTMTAISIRFGHSDNLQCKQL